MPLARNSAISEICSLTAGHSFRKKPEHHPDGTVFVVQPKDILTNGVFKTHELCRTNQIPKRLLKKGDVLLINRGRFTASVFDGSLDAPCVATSAFMVLTPKEPAQVLPDYLALYLNSTEGQNCFKRLNETTTIPFISRTNLESIIIPVPPLERQKKLVALERTTQRYTQLTARKTELLNSIINHQLIFKRRTP